MQSALGVSLTLAVHANVLAKASRSGCAPNLPAFLIEDHQERVATLVKLEPGPDTGLPILEHHASTGVATQAHDRRAVRVNPHTDRLIAVDVVHRDKGPTAVGNQDPEQLPAVAGIPDNEAVLIEAPGVHGPSSGEQEQHDDQKRDGAQASPEA